MATFALEDADLDRVFPFHVAWDEQGIIVQAGTALVRRLGSLVGTSIDDVFVCERDPTRPLAGRTPTAQHQVMVLQHRETPLRLRGPWLTGPPTFVAASPTASTLPELLTQGLTAEDLAEHDPARDYLRRERALRTSLADGRAQVARLREERRELKQRNAESQRASEVKSAFLANLSHEIRTAMTTILGYSDLVGENLGDHEVVYDSLNVMRRSSTHLLGVINDILDLSRLESGETRVERVPVDLAATVRTVVRLLEATAQDQDLALTMHVADKDGPYLVESDPLRIRQIVVHLVSNAIKFTRRGGVDVTVREVDGHAVIDVEDTGIGMTEAQLCRAFDPFEQATQDDSPISSGIGLGLALCQRYVELMGGSIDVQSEPGVGSRFTVTVATTLAAAEAPAQAAGPLGTADTIDLTGLRVLVAEDGPDNQRLIRHVLESAHADVELVADGAAAILAARKALHEGHPFDVILMDIQMPVMDGYEATKTLRDAGYRLPIVALTANAMAQDRDRCLAAGCDDYATKPIRRQTLLQTVVQWAHDAEERIRPALA